VASVDVVIVAVPTLSADVPMIVVPSLKVTVPVAMEGETVAVRVTLWLEDDGLAEEVSVVMVVAELAYTG
jgi:hypothetical protein